VQKHIVRKHKNYREQWSETHYRQPSNPPRSLKSLSLNQYKNRSFRLLGLATLMPLARIQSCVAHSRSSALVSQSTLPSCDLSRIMADDALNATEFEPKKGWFYAHRHRCGTFLLEPQFSSFVKGQAPEGAFKIAADYDQDRCWLFKELIDTVNQIPACSRLSKGVDIDDKLLDEPLQEVRAHSLNTEKLSAGFSAHQASCAQHIFQVMEQCEQEIKATAKRQHQEQQEFEQQARQLKKQARFREIFFYAICGVGGMISQMAEVTPFFYLSDLGFDYSGMGQSTGGYDQMPNTIALVESVLTPTFQALLGNSLGARLLMMAVGKEHAHATVDETFRITRNGAVLIAALLVLYQLSSLVKAKNSVGSSHNQNEQDRFLKAMRLRRQVNGLLIRNFSALAGWLLFSKGQQGKSETVEIVLLAHLAHAFSRPLLTVLMQKGHRQLHARAKRLNDAQIRHDRLAQEEERAARDQLRQQNLDVRQQLGLQGQRPQLAGQFNAHEPLALLDSSRITPSAPLEPIIPLDYTLHPRGQGLARWMNRRRNKPKRDPYLTFPTPPEQLKDLSQKIAYLEQRYRSVGKVGLEDLLDPAHYALFVCPITLSVMTDPVSLPAGTANYTFERSAVSEWLQKNKSHPIVQNTPLPANTALVAEPRIKAAIEAWIDEKMTESDWIEGRPSL